MTEQITINRDVIEQLRSRWAGRAADTDDRLAAFTWPANQFSGAVRGNLSDPWKTKLGAEDYEPGATLNDKVEAVRANIAERAEAYRQAATNLQWGLQNLLEHSDKVDDFNSVTAAEFYEQMPAG